jgi:tRNA A-37 threonylcarbamoyl transferase component Bud32
VAQDSRQLCLEAIVQLNSFYKVAPGAEQFAPKLMQLAQRFAQDGETIYKARNEIRRVKWHGASVIVKSFKVPGLLRGLVYGQIKQSKSRRSFENALELQRLTVTTPPPIGYIEYRSSGALMQSFYVCYEWPATYTLREPLFDLNFLNREEVLHSFGRFVWQLHREQIHHLDLSPGNILVKETFARDAGYGSYKFCLVDINRMRIESLSLRQRLNNFAMLWASDEDLKTIVSSYTHASGDAPQQALVLALRCSQGHKHRANRKEEIKSLLGFH